MKRHLPPELTDRSATRATTSSGKFSAFKPLPAFDGKSLTALEDRERKSAETAGAEKDKDKEDTGVMSDIEAEVEEEEQDDDYAVDHYESGDESAGDDEPAANCALVLTMRHSLTAEGNRYIKSTAVALMEILKLVVCIGVVYMESGEMRTFSKKLRVEVAGKPLEMAKLMVPALLYTIQNNMLYEALQNLDAATYSVCYQTKILTTAVFSVILLRKRLSLTKKASSTDTTGSLLQ
eukprot:g4033.t1